MRGTLNTGGIWALTLTFLGGPAYRLRLKQGLKENEVCDVTSLVPKCMFLGESTLARLHAHRHGTHTQRTLRGCTKSEAALWASDPAHWSQSPPVPSLQPSRGGTLSTLLCRRKHWGPNVGRMLSGRSSSWWTDEGPGREDGLYSLGTHRGPVRWCCRTGVMGVAGHRQADPRTGGALWTVRPRPCPLESSSESPSTPPKACALDTRFATSPRPAPRGL